MLYNLLYLRKIIINDKIKLFKFIDYIQLIKFDEIT